MNQTDIKLLIDCPAHIPTLAKLWYDEIGKQWIKNASIDRAINTYTIHANRHTLPITWVAESNNHPIGMVSLRVNDGLTDTAQPWLGSLIVHPNHRNKKIGEALIQEVKNIAKNMGYQTLHLFALDPTIHQWYEKLGWHHVRKDRYDTHAVNVMATPL